MENKPAARKNSIQKNTVFNLIKTGSSILYPLIVFPYTSRVLGAASLGRVTFGNSIISYFNMLATLGVTAYAVRECSRVRNDREELGKVASQIHSINMCTTVIAYLALAVCLAVSQSLESYRTLIMIQSISILFATLGMDWLNTAMEDFRYITIRTCLFQVLALAMLFLCVKRPEHYMIYAITGVISSSGANLVNIFYRRRYCRVRFTFQMNWRRHLPPIILLFAMMLSQTILNSLDTTMLGLLQGDYEVGLYGAALKIKNIVSQMVASIAWVVMPGLSEQFARRDYAKVNQFLRGAAMFTAVVGIPCAVGLMSIPREILEIAGGKEYAAAASTLFLLTVSMVMGFATGIYGNMILLPSGREAQFMVACIAASVFNGIANYLLIPEFGSEGAALATVVSTLVILVITTWKIEKEIRFERMGQLLKAPLIGGAGIFLWCSLCKAVVENLYLKTGLAIAGSGLIYFAALALMKHEFYLEQILPVLRKLKAKLKRV